MQVEKFQVPLSIAGPARLHFLGRLQSFPEELWRRIKGEEST
jgi:hypothetical protein